jgi:hypothetical protein
MFPLPGLFDFDRQMLLDLANAMKADPAANPDNKKISAGYTFLGQFIDHDITFDPTSSLERQNDPGAVQNFRTPLLELDSVYGAGPSQDRFLYQKADPVLFVIGKDSNGTGDDLQRNADGTAIIGDPRNDENLMVSQIHMVFMKFHNAVVAELRRTPGFTGNVFEVAQRIVRWHYQWIIVNEFLLRILGQKTFDEIFKVTNGNMTTHFLLFNKRTNNFGERFIPVEFAVAAYRFGHSQVRGRYDVNNIFKGIRLFPTPPVAPNEDFLFFDEISDLVPGKLNQSWNVAWGRFFEMVNSAGPNKNVNQDAQGLPQLGKQIDTHVSEPLFAVPPFAARQPSTDDDDSPILAFRNLMRGKSFGLPYGQWVARRLKAVSTRNFDILTLSHPKLAADKAKLKALGLHENKWPLWFYILKEAEVLEGGEHLGPVGGHIVGETFASLLEGDVKSYLWEDSGDKDWTPDTNEPFKIPAVKNGTFTMPDLIRFALGAADARTGVIGI